MPDPLTFTECGRAAYPGSLDPSETIRLGAGAVVAYRPSRKAFDFEVLAASPRPNAFSSAELPFIVDYLTRCQHDGAGGVLVTDGHASVFLSPDGVTRVYWLLGQHQWLINRRPLRPDEVQPEEADPDSPESKRCVDMDAEDCLICPR